MKTTSPRPRTHSPANVPARPTAEVTAKLTRSQFACMDCGVMLRVPDKKFLPPSFRSNCQNCDRPFSIESVIFDDDAEVVELFGCEYAGTVPTMQIQKSSIDQEATIFDALTSRWEVQCKNGESFSFEYFSDLRKWIEQGKIKKGDSIIPQDGKKYLVESYPGTADLFGNPYIRTEARFAITGLEKKKSRARRSLRIRPIHLYSLASFVLLASMPFAIRAWKIHKGEALVASLVAQQNLSPPENVLPVMLNAKDYFRQGTPEHLPRAVHEYIRVLAAQPKNLEALSGLAETWTEMSALTSDRSDLERAKKVIEYASTLSGRYPILTRAHARLLWREGKQAEAMERLQEEESGSAETSALMGRISMEQKDLENASIYLTKAIATDPMNSSYLKMFVDVLEQQSKYLEAAGYLRRVQKIEAGDPTHAKRLAILFRKAGDLDEAEAMYRQAIRQGDDAESNRFALISILALQKRNPDVIQESLRYFDEHPGGEYWGDVRKLYKASLASTESTSSEALVALNRKKAPSSLRRIRNRR